MGNKDRGGRTAKKEAAKGLKEKRLEKKMKRTAHKAAGNPSVDRTFDR